MYKSSCNVNCPISYYKDIGTLTCKECHSTCLACNGPSYNQCLECEEGYLYDFEENLCIFGSKCP